MAEKAGEYDGGGRPTEAERVRLRELAQYLDPMTQKWLGALGIPAGWRCLEVGSGEGSMARWVADQVAPTGHVVAADLDLRFLDDMDHPGVLVRRLDIREDAIEGGFDLAWCRTLLIHLPDHVAALRRLRDALVPGGVLFVQESDMCVCEAVDRDHPEARTFEDFHRRAYAAIRAARHFDTALGRSLPATFRELGLEDVGYEILCTIERGDSPMTRQLARTFGGAIGPELVKHGVVPADALETVMRLYSDPGFEYLTGVNIGIWGRKPAARGPGREAASA